jgi:4'-phosphopantetheinyl transferase EntD
MGIVLKRDVEEDCLIGLWEIKEDFDTLFSKVSLDKTEKKTLFDFKNIARQVEWLSVRALLNELTQCDSKIIYNEEHKPFLFDNSFNISISHSNKLTSILLSKHKKVGIDLEYRSHRINRIAHKFINKHEYITCDKTFEQLHLYIHWCAKEALYKICDKKNINFKENLTIKPFEIEHEGQITGMHHDEHIHDEFLLKYEVRDNYVIVFCCK